MKIQMIQKIVVAVLALVISTQAYASLSESPTVKNAVIPELPTQYVQFDMRAKAKIMFDLTEYGTVENPELIEASSTRFGRNIMSVINDWEFTPATENGTAIRKKVILPVVHLPSPSYR